MKYMYRFMSVIMAFAWFVMRVKPDPRIPWPWPLW